MLILLFITVFLLLFFINKTIIKNKLIVKGVNLLNIWWIIILIISTFNPYGLYEVSTYTYLIVIISLFFLNFGNFVSYFITLKNKNFVSDDGNNEVISTISYQLDRVNRSKIMFILTIIFTFIVFRYMNLYKYEVVVNNNLAESRMMRFEIGTIFKSPVEILLYMYIIETFAHFAILYTAISIVWFKFSKLFFLTLFFTYCYVSFGSGRLLLIELIIIIIILFIIRKNYINESFEKFKLKKQNYLIYIIMFLFSFISYFYSIFLSLFRTGNSELTTKNLEEGNSLFFEHIVIYLVGALRTLDYGINIHSQKIESYTFGTLSFGGMDQLINNLFNIFGIKYLNNLSIVGKITFEPIYIGGGNEFNALYTYIFPMYLDFGICGVILISFIFGFSLNKLIFFFQKKIDLFSLLILVFFIKVLFIGVLKANFQSPSVLILFVILYVYFINNKLNYESE